MCRGKRCSQRENLNGSQEESGHGSCDHILMDNVRLLKRIKKVEEKVVGGQVSSMAGVVLFTDFLRPKNLPKAHQKQNPFPEIRANRHIQCRIKTDLNAKDKTRRLFKMNDKSRQILKTKDFGGVEKLMTRLRKDNQNKIEAFNIREETSPDVPGYLPDFSN